MKKVYLSRDYPRTDESVLAQQGEEVAMEAFSREVVCAKALR